MFVGEGIGKLDARREEVRKERAGSDERIEEGHGEVLDGGSLRYRLNLLGDDIERRNLEEQKELGRAAFELIQALGVPVVVHTGSGIPWAAPSLLAPVARRYPGMPIVVAHAGGMILSGEAACWLRTIPTSTWSAVG